MHDASIVEIEIDSPCGIEGRVLVPHLPDFDLVVEESLLLPALQPLTKLLSR